MKIKNTRKLLTTPLLVSAICALVGGGLLLYYYLYAKDSSIASFVTCYAIVAVGALSLISIVFILNGVILLFKDIRKSKFDNRYDDYEVNDVRF